MIQKGGFESVHCLDVQMTELLQWLVIRVEDELLALEVLLEVIHTPDSGCGLQQEWGVVLFVIFQLPGCEQNGIELAILVHLSAYCPESSRCVCRARGGVRDQGVLSVDSGKSH